MKASEQIAEIEPPQQEVEFQKEYRRYMGSLEDKHTDRVSLNLVGMARHFYELGLKTRKEE